MFQVFRHLALEKQLVALWLNRALAGSMELNLTPSNDGLMRGVYDSAGWKRCVIDTNFRLERRNIALALSTDGIRPFKHSQRTMWPIVFKVSTRAICFPAEIHSSSASEFESA